MNKNKLIGLDENVALGLGYLFPIIALIAVLVDNQASYYAKFHCWQSFFLFLAISIISGMTWLFGTVLFIYPIIVAILAFQGKDHRVPGISILVEKIIN